MRNIDIPPVWLAAFLLLAWGQATWWPVLTLGDGWVDFLGGVFVGAGVLLMVLAIMQFRRHRTSVMPHDDAQALIQSGVYKYSRNPIYVADALILAGFVLRWDAVLSLPLIPVFVWVLERRFVIPEENRLRRRFRAQYAAYERKVRRWL